MPSKSMLFKRNWNIRAGSPVATTERRPPATKPRFWLVGGITIFGGVSTVKVATELVAAPWRLVTTAQYEPAELNACTLLNTKVELVSLVSGYVRPLPAYHH